MIISSFSLETNTEYNLIETFCQVLNIATVHRHCYVVYVWPHLNRTFFLAFLVLYAYISILYSYSWVFGECIFLKQIFGECILIHVPKTHLRDYDYGTYTFFCTCPILLYTVGILLQEG